MRPLLLLALSLALPAAAQPAGPVLFVDADAPVGGDGQTWATAFDELREALAFARANPDAVEQVWVAEGVYRPTAGTDRDESFDLVGGVALYGGFEGTEDALDERDVVNNKTVLSGDIGAPGVATDNSYHVVRHVLDFGETADPVRLDGFTVTGGYADGGEYTGGGGLIALASGSVYSEIVITRCTFTDNFAERSAGGVLLSGPFRGLVERSAFTHNSGDLGGGDGLEIFGIFVRVVRSVFTHNQEDGIKGYGLVADSVFVAENGGTGIFSRGLSLTNSVVMRNGFRGIYGSGRVEIANTQILGNQSGGARFDGIGYPAQGEAILANVTFVGNKPAFDSYGAFGIFVVPATLVNVTAVANGSGGSSGSSFYAGGSEPELQNAVFWANEGGFSTSPFGGSFTFDQAIVEGGCPDAAACEGVISADPRFVRDPDPGPDGEWGTPDDDYGDLRLREDSPAVDAGQAALLPTDFLDLDDDGDTAEPLPVDLAGGPRVEGGQVDLGAYERAVPAPVVAIAPDGSPLVPSDGGALAYTATLTNPTDAAQAAEAWVTVALPDGTDFGVVAGPRAVALAPQQTLARALTARVPASAPVGTYTLTLRVGTYPDAVLASDQFTFEKVGARPAAHAEAAETGAYPNPFRGRTTLRFSTEQAADVRLAIYDALGREVAVLVDGPVEAGLHAAALDGAGLASGAYVWRLVVGHRVETGRLTLLR